MALNRRGFLSASAAGAAVVASKPGPTAAAPGRTHVGALRTVLEQGELRAQYPDPSSPIVVVALSEPVEGGLGPGRNVVAYSLLCTHRGCTVAFRGDRLVCPCHFSVFDPARGGACEQGPASTGLPRVRLEIDDDEQLYAAGIEGILWGRREGR
ncbi:MAG: arsenate reductase (azurin) small subunit [Myxococcota bacterium]